MISLLQLSGIADGIERIVETINNLQDVFLEIIVFVFSVLLAPLGLILGKLHAFTVGFMSYSPVPGEEAADNFYLFSEPAEGDIFYTLMTFISSYIEPIALLSIFFGISLLLFLRIFDIVIQDFGLDTVEAKQRLFIAPILILLWVPIANLVLYLAFGVSDFLGEIEFEGIGLLSDSVEDGAVLTDTSGGLSIQSYLSAIVPEDINALDVQSSLIVLALAYLAFIPAAIVYILAVFGAILRVALLYFLYILGPIGIAMWAFNWKDISRMGGTYIRWFILIALMPIAVTFIDTVAPVIFLSLEEILAESISSFQPDTTPAIGGIEAADYGTVAPTEILVVGFILATPVLIGIMPWAIVIGFNKAMKLGTTAAVGAAGVATAGAGIGAMGLAANGTSITQAASGLKEKALTGVSGDALGTGIGMSAVKSGGIGAVKSGLTSSASRVSKMTKQKTSDFGDKLRDSTETLSYTAKEKWDEMGGAKGVEKMIADSDRLSRSTFGSAIQQTAKADVKRQEALRNWQAQKTKKDMAKKVEQDKSTESSVIRDDETGEVVTERLHESDGQEALMREGEKKALANEVDDNLKMKKKYARYLAEEEGKTRMDPRNLTDEEIDNMVKTEDMIEQYYQAARSTDGDRFNILGDSAEQMDEAIQSITREQVDDAVSEMTDERYYGENYREAKDEYLAQEESEIGMLENDLVEAIHEGTVHQAGFDEKISEEIRDAAMSKQGGQLEPDKIVSDDTSKSRGKVMKEFIDEYLETGDIHEALSVPGVNDLTVENHEEVEQELQEIINKSADSLTDINLEADIGTDEYLEEIHNEYEKAMNEVGPSKEALENRNKTSAENMVERFQAISEHHDELSDDQLEQIFESTFVEDMTGDVQEFINSKLVDEMGGASIDTKEGLRENGLDKILEEYADEMNTEVEEFIMSGIKESAQSAGVKDKIDFSNDKTKQGIEDLIIHGIEESITLSDRQIKDMESNLTNIPDAQKELVMDSINTQAKEFINSWEQGTKNLNDAISELDAEKKREVIPELESIDFDSYTNRDEDREDF